MIHVYLHITAGLFSRAVLTSQQNGAEGTDISHPPLAPTYAYRIINIHPPQSDAYVTIDEPMSVHHNHPISIVHIRVHSWRCIFTIFTPSLYRCVMMRIHH